ncbi:hypothetical protein OS493_015650 [Desmophyllum pertusum]|uniref:Large ribosomal subunit protein uL3m n=1 Tax=Desmophyllum pertusum TaxID=174260 RepID=A0A9W9YP62_9CNID|nr:hypothetical protein OS493_015650 [Desmophyllum pertusum]
MEKEKPVTMVEIKECQVIQTRISRVHGGRDHKTELQIGAVEETQLYTVRKTQYGHFKKFGSNPKKKVRSFSVTQNGLLHPGTPLYAAHFHPGQYVKTQGVTIDRGFQGVMKRWKMKGQPATHGVSKTHRKMGATGGGQDQEESGLEKRCLVIWEIRIAQNLLSRFFALTPSIMSCISLVIAQGRQEAL